jgi:hypothetical protein
MPSRLLREGILDSEAVCSLSFQAEVFYRRLMSVVDDFGRYDGRPGVLRSRLYPLQIDKVREADIPRWIAECETAGLIALYSVSGKQYILFRKLGSPRNKDSKWPPPPEGVETAPQLAIVNGCAQLKTDANNCTQPFTSVPGSGSGSGSGSSAGSGTRKDSGEVDKPPSPPPVLTFPAIGDGPKSWPLTGEQLDRWRTLYPGTDVLAECRKALGWCEANPKKRKTAGGMAKFLVNWLNNAANGGKASPAPRSPPPAAGESPLDRARRLRAEMESGRTPGGDP